MAIFNDFESHFTSQDGLPKSDGTDLFAQGRPKMALRAPKSVPRAPETPPRAPKMAPRAPKMISKALSGRPTSVQDGAKAPLEPQKCGKKNFHETRGPGQFIFGLLVVFRIASAL